MEAAASRPEATGASARGFLVGTPLTVLALALAVGEDWNETPGSVLIGVIVAAALVGSYAGIASGEITKRFDDAMKDVAEAWRTRDWTDVPDTNAAWPRWFTRAAVLTWTLFTGAHLLVVTGTSYLVASRGVPMEDRHPDLWWQTAVIIGFVQVLGFLGGLIVGLLGSTVRRFRQWSRSASSVAERAFWRACAAFLVVACVSAVPVALASEDQPASRRGLDRLVSVARYGASTFDDPEGRGVDPAIAFAAQAGVVLTVAMLVWLVIAGIGVALTRATQRRKRRRRW